MPASGGATTAAGAAAGAALRGGADAAGAGMLTASSDARLQFPATSRARNPIV